MRMVFILFVALVLLSMGCSKLDYGHGQKITEKDPGLEKEIEEAANMTPPEQPLEYAEHLPDDIVPDVNPPMPQR